MALAGGDSPKGTATLANAFAAVLDAAPSVSALAVALAAAQLVVARRQLQIAYMLLEPPFPPMLLSSQRFLCSLFPDLFPALLPSYLQAQSATTAFSLSTYGLSADAAGAVAWQRARSRPPGLVPPRPGRRLVCTRYHPPQQYIVEEGCDRRRSNAVFVLLLRRCLCTCREPARVCALCACILLAVSGARRGGSTRPFSSTSFFP